MEFISLGGMLKSPRTTSGVSIVRGAAQEDVHLIKEVTERSRRAIDHPNVEFERKCDRQTAWNSKADLGRGSRGRTW